MPFFFFFHAESSRTKERSTDQSTAQDFPFSLGLSKNLGVPRFRVLIMCIWWWWLFHRLRGFWENVRPLILRLRFSFLLLRLFFFKVEISSRKLISLFVPGSVHSGSASRDDCGRMFPAEDHTE